MNGLTLAHQLSSIGTPVDSIDLAENRERFAELLNDLKIKPLILNGKNIVPEIEVHSMGWNAQAVNPFTGKMVLISQDGKSMITN